MPHPKNIRATLSRRRLVTRTIDSSVGRLRRSWLSAATKRIGANYPPRCRRRLHRHRRSNWSLRLGFLIFFAAATVKFQIPTRKTNEPVTRLPRQSIPRRILLAFSTIVPWCDVPRWYDAPAWACAESYQARSGEVILPAARAVEPSMPAY
jgi:hypothetical protein